MNSKQQKWLLLIVVVLAINAAVWFLGVEPALTGIAEVKRKTAALQDKQTQFNRRLQELKDIDLDLLLLEQQDQLVLIPNPGSLREMMTELEAVAGAMDNKLESMTFQPPNDEEITQSLTISMILAGEYKDLYSYIQYLENHSRLILVDSFSLSGAEDSMNATIQLTLFSDDFDPYTPHEAPGRDNPFEVQ